MITRTIIGDVALIMLARPEKRNALTPEMVDRLGEELTAVPSQVRVVVLGGEGPVFCSGFDLKLCTRDPGVLRLLLAGLTALVMKLKTMPQIVVVAAHGGAVAGGCAMLSGGDFVITDEAATLGYPVLKLGISPAVSAPFIRMAIGDGAARERMLDTRLVNGAEACRIGLAHECVRTPEDVLPRAMAIAAQLAVKPRCGLTATKNLMNEMEGIVHPHAPGAAGHAAWKGLQTSLALVGDVESTRRLEALWV